MTAGVEGRLALVTGAAGHLGRQIATALAGAGARLLLTDRAESGAALAKTAARCTEVAPGGDVATIVVDVTDVDAVRAALEARDADDPVRLLVNNAGYQGVFANTIDLPIDDLRLVLDVNVVGAFVVLQAAARDMRRAGGGAIVNLASMAGVSGAPNMPAYSASKAAIGGLTRAAAKDLAPFGIRVNAVSPGFVGPGPMWERQVAEQARVPSPYYADEVAAVAEQMIGSVPLRRYGSADEVAATVLFLLSGGAGFITGTEIEISGGGR